MRKIERTGQFKRDYKREAKGRHRETLDADLVPVLVALANDQPLEPRHRDHALIGNWKDHRDCHVKPDPFRMRYTFFAFERRRRRDLTDTVQKDTLSRTDSLEEPVAVFSPKSGSSY